MRIFNEPNISAEEYRLMTPAERAEYIREVKIRNSRNISDFFASNRDVAYMIIIDGEVIKQSPYIDTYPQEKEILDLIKKYGGKFPIIFDNPSLRIIEQTTLRNSASKGLCKVCC